MTAPAPAWSSGTRRRSASASTPTTSGTRTASRRPCWPAICWPRCAAGRSGLQDRLDELARAHGLFVTGQFSVRVSDLDPDRRRDGPAAQVAPPATLLGDPVDRGHRPAAADRRHPAADRPASGWSSGRPAPSRNSSAYLQLTRGGAGRRRPADALAAAQAGGARRAGRARPPRSPQALGRSPVCRPDRPISRPAPAPAMQRRVARRAVEADSAVRAGGRIGDELQARGAVRRT